LTADFQHLVFNYKILLESLGFLS